MKKVLPIIFLTLTLILSACCLSACECSHEYGEWEITTQATVEQDGVKTRACTKCGEEETAVINKKYLLNLSTSNENLGTFEGDNTRQVSWGDEVTVIAKPEEIAVFRCWFNGTEVVNNLESYTFVMPQSNVNLTAIFDQNIFNLSVTSNNDSLGVVSETANVVAKGTEISVTATSAGNNIFLGWFNGETLVSANREYTFEMPASDYSLVAKFKIPSWDGSVATSFAGGDGTLSNPYQISNGAELAYLSSLLATDHANLRDYNRAYYTLTADIDLGGREWQPIGVYYTGTNSTNTGLGLYQYSTFFGQGHTVSNFKITAPSESYYRCFGLFGYLSGRIKNLHVEGGVINLPDRTVGTEAGLLVGFLDRGGLVENCSAKGTVAVSVKTNNVTVNCGGLVGTMQGSDVKRCYTEGTVNVSSSSSGVKAGGIVGSASMHSMDRILCNIQNVYSLTEISATSSYTNGQGVAGGIVGTSGANVSYAYHVGKISVRSQGSNNAVCGGIAGTAATVSNVYHEGGLYCFTNRSSPDINGCVGDADTATRTKMYSRGQTYKNNSPFSLPTSGSDKNTRITLEDDMVEEFFKDTLGFITQYWNFDGISATQVKYPTLIKDAPQEF